MNVGITELRAELAHWLDRARQGEDVVVTDRGIPVVRIVGLTTTTTIERLTAEGVISAPTSTNKPVASGMRRPRASASIADLISELRD